MTSSYTLGPRFKVLIKDLVSTGRYNNASEVVRDGLRMVEERERRLAALDTMLSAGIADAEAGRVHGIEETRARLKRAVPSRRRKE